MNNSKRMLIKRLLLIFIISFSVVGYVPSVASNTSWREEHYLKKYNFTSNCVTHGICVWKKELSSFKGQPNIHYLEIGVFEGGSFIWMLENILTHPTSTATGIDPLNVKYEQTLYDNLEISGLCSKAKIIKGFSQLELKKLPFDSFNIIYIDGDHSASAVLNDAILSWPLLKKGGVLIFDDYLWEVEKLPPRKKAADSDRCFYCCLQRLCRCSLS